jgi:hypothetical protein
VVTLECAKWQKMQTLLFFSANKDMRKSDRKQGKLLEGNTYEGLVRHGE